MTAAQVTEEQMIKLVRNALMVAGQEMGAEGDHWPVINSTIQSIMQDWDQLQIERNVHAELRTHLAKWLNDLDAAITECPDDIRPELQKCARELRNIYDAYFETVKVDASLLDEDTLPPHIKRAEVIINTLGGDNG